MADYIRLERVRIIAETPESGELVGIKLRYFMKYTGMDEFEGNAPVVLRPDSGDSLDIDLIPIKVSVDAE